MFPGISISVLKGTGILTSPMILPIRKDNVQVGAQGAQATAKLVSDEGAIVLVTIPGQPNLVKRFVGVKQVPQRFSDFKIKEMLNDKGDPAVANRETSHGGLLRCVVS